VEEAFAPLADDLASGIQPFRDEIVGQIFGSHEHDFSTEDLKIRQRIFSRAMPEYLFLVGGENYRKWAFSWHGILALACAKLQCHNEAYLAR
jgi:hypothetical protein